MPCPVLQYQKGLPIFWVASGCAFTSGKGAPHIGPNADDLKEVG